MGWGGGEASAVERVTVVDFNSLIPHRCTYVRIKNWGAEFTSCEEGNQLNCGRSVVLLGCPLVPEILLQSLDTRGFPPQ